MIDVLLSSFHTFTSGWQGEGRNEMGEHLSYPQCDILGPNWDGFQRLSLFYPFLIPSIVFAVLVQKTKTTIPTPSPGSKRLHLIGSLHDVSFKYQWLTYEVVEGDR